MVSSNLFDCTMSTSTRLVRVRARVRARARDGDMVMVVVVVRVRLRVRVQVRVSAPFDVAQGELDPAEHLGRYGGNIGEIWGR